MEQENNITVPIEEETEQTESTEIIEETEITESTETTDNILMNEYVSYDYTEQLVLINENLNNLNYTMNCFFILGVGLLAACIVYKFFHRLF